MLPRIFTAFIAIFMAACSFGLLANNVSNASTFEKVGPCPPAPTPTNLVVTGVMPTSISLAWDGADTHVFLVETTDETTGIAYPPKYVGHDKFATIDGLISAHYHTIRVSASNCSEGPWSSSIVTHRWSGTIIMEEIIAAPCTLSTNYTNFTAQTFCVAKSGPEPPATLQNIYMMRIKKASSDYTEDLGIAYYFDNGSLATAAFGHVNDPVDNKYYFELANGQANCYYKDDANPNGIHVFSFEVLPEMTEAQIKVRLIPVSSGFQYVSCGSVTCNGAGTGGASGGDPGGRSMPNNINFFTTPPTPNPFSESAILRYELSAPASVSIQLFDAIGHLVQVLQQPAQLSEGEYTATIQGANLPNGTYFAVIQKGSDRQVFPLVRQE